MNDACPGPCNARYRKARRDYDAAMLAYEADLAVWQTRMIEEGPSPAGEAPRPEPPAEPDIAPTAGEPVWCDLCRALVRRALTDLDDLASLLGSWADGHRGAPSGEKTGARRPTSGSPSPISDTLDELYRSLTKVEDDWRAARGLGARPRRGDVEARARCIAWLLGQLDQILRHPGSAQFGRATLAWQRRLQALTRSDPVVRRRPGPCPRCDRRALRTRDDGYTMCAKCGRLLDEDEYQEIVEQQAGEPTILEDVQAS